MMMHLNQAEVGSVRSFALAVDIRGQGERAVPEEDVSARSGSPLHKKSRFSEKGVEGDRGADGRLGSRLILVAVTLADVDVKGEVVARCRYSDLVRGWRGSGVLIGACSTKEFN
ncbi:unnamed protein product [Ixodes pacificus]